MSEEKTSLETLTDMSNQFSKVSNTLTLAIRNSNDHVSYCRKLLHNLDTAKHYAEQGLKNFNEVLETNLVGSETKADIKKEHAYLQRFLEFAENIEKQYNKLRDLEKSEVQETGETETETGAKIRKAMIDGNWERVVNLLSELNGLYAVLYVLGIMSTDEFANTAPVEIVRKIQKSLPSDVFRTVLRHTDGWGHGVK